MRSVYVSQGFEAKRSTPLLPLTLSHSSFCIALFLYCAQGLLVNWAFDMMTSFQAEGLIVATCPVLTFNSPWLKIHDGESPSKWACQLLLLISFWGPASRAFHLSRTQGLAPRRVYPGSFWKIQMPPMQPQLN